MAVPSKYIMIVEDEMMIALHIEDTLNQLGHRVVTATTKAQAHDRNTDAEPSEGGRSVYRLLRHIRGARRAATQRSHLLPVEALQLGQPGRRGLCAAWDRTLCL